MNFLFHAYLSSETPAALAGSLLGDFIKGRSFDHLPAEIASAVRLHRSIDVFADQHPIYQRSRLRLDPGYRRVSGIIIDLVYDHFLAKRWSEFSDVSIEDFARQVYTALTEYRHCWTDRFAEMVPYMVANDWLSSYRHIKGTDRALKGMSHRMKYDNPLDTAINEIHKHYDNLEDDFLAMMPELIAFAHEQKSKTNSN